jgi:AbrB family looped-hinge helix DNA binding protein
MSIKESVKVSSRHQISLPSRARRTLNIEAGDRLLVDIQDNMIILLPQPEDFVSYMAGLHKEIWQQVDTAEYLNQEREAWPEVKSQT